MSTLTVIQARLGSQRLPGKVLADIGGKTVLERVIDRVRAAELPGPLVVATTPRAQDNLIEEACRVAGVDCYRSSEHDVLNRFYRAAVHYQACEPQDTIVRVTADCPLLCPELLTDVVKAQIATSADYVGVNGAPKGLGQEALSFGALEAAWRETDMQDDREHVVTYIEDNSWYFDVRYVEANEALRSRSHWRLTLDDAEDLELLRRLFAATAGALFEMRTEEILDFVASDVGMLALAERTP